MKPHLKQKEKFEKILKDYKPSDKALQLIEDLHVVVLAGAAGAGRNTIINSLVEGGRYDYFVSDTTRPKRIKDGEVIEKDGREYWFISEEQMLQQLQNGEMMEAAIIHKQQVSGTSIREFRRILKENKIAISEIEPQGVDTYMQARPSTVAIFVIPPSFETWIARMEARAHMPDDELKNRLESAVWEFEWALKHDYYHVVVNDNIENAATEINHISTTEPAPDRSDEKLQVIRNLLEDTKVKLAKIDL